MRSISLAAWRFTSTLWAASFCAGVWQAEIEVSNKSAAQAASAFPARAWHLGLDTASPVLPEPLLGALGESTSSIVLRVLPSVVRRSKELVARGESYVMQAPQAAQSGRGRAP